MAKETKVIIVPWVGHGRISSVLGSLGLGVEPGDHGTMEVELTRREIHEVIDKIIDGGLNVMVKHWRQPPEPELYIGVDTKGFSQR